MDNMRMRSRDINQQNIEKLGNIFPNVITESEDGKYGVNFELLQQELSNFLIDGDEYYGLNWVGKKQSILEANKPITKTLRPKTHSSINWEDTGNIYIEGDNLESLKLLQESYLNSIKVIYIDPPYNTGSDFVYKDDYKINKEDYEEKLGIYDEYNNRLLKNTDNNGRFHSDWCSMIYPRLKLAYNLLKDDGVLFVSIDDNEHSNLQKICDEIFGRINFIGTVTWEKRTKAQNTKTAREKFQSKTEYILVYKKNINKMDFNLEVTGKKEYDKTDEKGKYREKVVEEMSASGMRGRSTMVFPIKGIYPGEGKQWKVGKDLVKFYQDRDDVTIIEGKPYFKVRPEDEDQGKYRPFWSHFFDKDTYGTAETGKTELSKILGTTSHGFETVKPVDLIKKLLFHIKKTNNIEVGHDDIILDFFSGSSTTAHAVMQLNAEDGGNRKYIMVQIPEETEENSDTFKAGYKTISELGIDRIKKAGELIKKQIAEENNSNPNEKEKAIPDVGFRLFSVDSSNMKDIYYSASEYTQRLLASLESNIKEDRTDLDLLYGVMIDWGLPLSLKHKKEIIDNSTIHIVDYGSLIACFEESISEKVVTEIAKKQPLRVVFRDSSFSNSPDKINVTEIFKLYAPSTAVKVI